nr:hypothetical protein [Tanacetum cinerariifolium]
MSSSTVTYTSISSDYEEPSDAGSPRAPPSPDYVPGPEHPPLPNYVPEPNLKEDPEEDLKEDLADYPADGGKDDDDDVEKEEEHLDLNDSSVALIAEYASAPTPPSPPPSPLFSLSSPLPYISSPSLPPPSPPTTSPTYAEAPLGYKAARIWLRAALRYTHHPSKIPYPPLLLPSTTHRDDLPEVGIPIQKRAHFTAPTGRFEVGESSSAAAATQAGHTLAHTVDNGFIDTIDASIRAAESRAMTAIEVVNDKRTWSDLTAIIDGLMFVMIGGIGLKMGERLKGLEALSPPYK